MLNRIADMLSEGKKRTAVLIHSPSHYDGLMPCSDAGSASRVWVFSS